MSQTISEYKIEGQEKLARYKQLLNKNELTDEEWKEANHIKDKFGDHPMFIKARNDNYDARAMNVGFGAPDCSCHISPPCEACIIWTNACDERIDNGEPGCEIVEHDCPVGRGQVRP